MSFLLNENKGSLMTVWCEPVVVFRAFNIQAVILKTDLQAFTVFIMFSCAA